MNAREAVRDYAERNEHDGPDGGRESQHGMHQRDEQQVRRQPWRIEQRQNAGPAQEGAKLGDVAECVGVDASGIR